MLNSYQINNTIVKVWADDIEPGASQQIANLARVPGVFRHIAIMPDCHQGYGMPIGGVAALQGAIIPNAVGVDIGCGMCALKLNLRQEDLPRNTLKSIMQSVRDMIPLGVNRHKGDSPYCTEFMPRVPGGPVTEEQMPNARSSLGTLGGGNHFIEIQKDMSGQVWIMIHSGSRNLGKQVAEHYHKVARALNERKKMLPTGLRDLSFLPLDSDEGKMYLQEMQYCVAFALANRRTMMVEILKAFEVHVGKVGRQEDMINIAHNYARQEKHFGRDVMVHRKGATSAQLNEIGIIPGSQGARSYIVKGKGNPESFCSCSHGAGRQMSRTKAQEELNLADEIRKLNEQGIIHGIRHRKDLDEAAGAYKDINRVMANQKDLVDVMVELLPLAVVKG